MSVRPKGDAPHRDKKKCHIAQFAQIILAGRDRDLLAAVIFELR